MNRPDPARGATGVRPGRSRAGSVILLVLMTLLLTAFALTKYLEKASVDLMADAREARADRLRVHAYSALETVLAVLQEFQTTDSGLHSPAEGWGDPLEFAGYAPPDGLTVEVTLEDESAKIPLTHADFPMLRDLFILLGQKQSDAEQLADALLVWMQQGYEPANSFSARATDYERAAIPHDPPLRSLHSFAELASIQFVRDRLFDENGRPNDLWRDFVSSVSLFDFSQPNTNTARMTTLAAYGGYDESIDEADQRLPGWARLVRPAGAGLFPQRAGRGRAGGAGRGIVAAGHAGALPPGERDRARRRRRLFG